MNQTSVVVIGYGSIGKRHAQLLQNLGHKVTVVSKRKIEGLPSHSSITSALEKSLPTYVVIANATVDHHRTLSELARLNFKGKVLVEKPIFAENAEIPPHSFQGAYVGYNLRFHPILKKIKQILVETGDPLSISAYVGQHLPQWRERDYRLSYSAHKEQGGGALRDLSHEIDYVCWLSGNWERLSAIGGKISGLQISSDDNYSILSVHQNCPSVSVHMNYLDVPARRDLKINTNSMSIYADFVTNTLQINDKKEQFQVERDSMYSQMHQAVLTQNGAEICTLEEGLRVMRFIEAAEIANSTKTWVQRAPEAD